MALTTRLFRAIRLVRRRQLALWLYVAVVVFGSAGLTAFAVQDHYDVTGRPGADWALVAAFTILIVLLERPRTDLVGQGNISLSFVGIFTAAFVAGPAVTGIAAFVGVFLARAIDREPPWYKRLFNAALFALSGVCASYVFFALEGDPTADRTTQAAPAALLAMFTGWAVNHALVAGVIAIDYGRSLRQIWDEKIRWFIPHYLALGISSYAMAMGYLALGPTGAAIFMLPVATLWFVVKQYTERTRRDAEELQHANVALARSEERFRSLVQNAPGLIAVVNSHGTVTFMNPPGVMEVASHAGADPSKFSSIVHPDDRERVEASIGRAMEHPDGDHSLDMKIRDADGEWRDYEAVVTNLFSNSSVRGIVVNARDVTERTELENQLRHEAFHDPLTNLPNRALFMDRLRAALELETDAGGRVAVLFLDLDRFKVVNDSLGHNVGDELLVALAGRLRETAGEGPTVARFGGDEFVILLPNVHSEDDVTELAQRILDSLRHPVKLLGHNTSVTASVGISISNPNRRQPRELLRSADVALFHAKELGRGRYQLFDETLDRYSVERLELEAELRQAVELDQLILEYQPEIDLASGRIIGVEALVRWDHPQRGRIPPGDFIALAEETGEIVGIGKWVLGEACRQAAAWKSVLPGNTPFTMSINLSANEFMEAGLVWEVLRTLRETGLDATSLRMEITESVLLHDSPFMNEVFLDLKQLGISIAIDDFGTGYSSLSYLRKLPADVLKIDRTFVADVDTDPREAAVVQSVVAVADALGVRVVAEGIERPEQLDYLTAIGCDSGQGFYFSRPVAPEAIEEMLQASRDAERTAS